MRKRGPKIFVPVPIYIPHVRSKAMTVGGKQSKASSFSFQNQPLKTIIQMSEGDEQYNRWVISKGAIDPVGVIQDI
jgi:hypothetical protein